AGRERKGSIARRIARPSMMSRDALSSALIGGEVSDQLLREIASLSAADISPPLENAMSMALSDTPDARLRNLLAIALSKAGSQQAISRIVELLSQSKTAGTRSSLLYAL